MAKAVPVSLAGRPPRRFGAVVLAAGGSRRMQQPKQLMPIDGVPLIVRTIHTVLASSAWPVVAVLGSFSDSIRPLLSKLPVQIVNNPQWEKGIGTSLRVGIEILDMFSTGLDGALVVLGDQPNLSVEALDELGRGLQSRETIVAARYAGVVGAPAIFGRSFFPELLSLPDQMGAQRLLREHAAVVTPLDLPELATDLDTPEDYQRFLESRKRSQQA